MEERLTLSVWFRFRVRVRVRDLSSAPALLVISTPCCCCMHIGCLKIIVCAQQDVMLQLCMDQILAMKEKNERLKDEIRAKQAEKERYVKARDRAYEQMRKE